VTSITDGHHVKKNYWYIMPERNPDIYYVEVPLAPHKVTFTTDMESIAFDVSYGTRHAFVVRLEDGTEARTEIRGEFKNLLRHERTSSTGDGDDLIPFTLGNNDKIYVQGRLNGGPTVSLQVDFGAGGSLIKESSVPKANMTFDGTIALRNSDGINEVRASSRNRLEIAGLVWRDVPFAVGSSMTHREDGIVGNSLFLDKVVEIDYRRMALVVRGARPTLGREWRRQDIYLDGGTVPFTQGTVSVGGSPHAGWFMMDTGAYTSILNSPKLSTTTKLAGELWRLLGPLGGSRHEILLLIGGEEFSGVNYSTRAYDGDPSSLGLLGNDVLKRFDLVIDNRDGVVFLRPNHHRATPFRNPERLVSRLGAVVFVGAGLGLLWRALRRR
jgi:Aspartyl protease